MKAMKIKRMQAGITQLDLATASNVSEIKICRVETGRCIAPPFLRERIANALMCELEELFDAEGKVRPLALGTGTVLLNETGA